MTIVLSGFDAGFLIGAIVASIAIGLLLILRAAEQGGPPR